MQLPARADLVDEASGLTAYDGQLTIVVSGVPEDSAALADRLGRYLPTDAEPPSAEAEEGTKGRAARRSRAAREAERARIAARDEARARDRWGVRLGTSTSRPRGWPTFAATSWSATRPASSSPAPSKTSSTRTPG
ncbi:MAG: hypothetical protein R2731_07090 [Nocardioides sp.]